MISRQDDLKKWEDACARAAVGPSLLELTDWRGLGPFQVLPGTLQLQPAQLLTEQLTDKSCEYTG